MGGWGKICCAVDFSRSSRLAMEKAAALAVTLGAELTLVHSRQLQEWQRTAPLPQAGEATAIRSPLDPRDLAQCRLEAGEQQEVGPGLTLPAWRADAERLLGRCVHASYLAGDPAEQIVRFARKTGFDLLVVGTHGRTGVQRLVLGSVAERIVRQAPCPVLVVRPREVAEEEEIATEISEIAQYR